MMIPKARVVVIDDEVNAAAALETLLREDGFDVERAHDGRSGLQIIDKFDPDVVLTDLRMTGMDGIELLARIKEVHPETMVILMTAYGTVKTAVKAMKLGAEDYLAKPVDIDELEVVLQKALEKKRLLQETRVLRERLEDKYHLDNVVGQSPEMLAVFKTIRQVAPSNSSILLFGESGTGKELFAQALHQLSPRKNRPFVKVACAALPETLLESELFGHEKGAFTGALFSRAGRFETADGGTLFLDEIGDISPTVQVKLLRFLEEREFERVGGNQGGRAHRRRHASGSSEKGGRRLIPRRSVLSSQRHRNKDPAAARSRRRHSAARRIFHSQIRGAQRQRDPRHRG
jgi:DNA-binding NtrC family response regulator